MNRIKKYLNSLGRGTRTVLLGLAVVFVSAGIAQAATTITTDISTGNVTASGTLGVTGVSTFVNASTTQSATIGTLWVGGNATTTSAGALSLKSTLTVGATGSAVANIVAGYCVTTAVAFTVASTTGVYANCTPYTSAGVAITNLVAGVGSGASRVFIMATSSLPAYIVVQSASTTAASTINVQMVNVSTTTASVTSAVYAFNFWAFQ